MTVVIALEKEFSVPKDDKNVERKEPNAIQRYFNETVGELRKVSWPTPKEAKNLTIVVIAVMVIMSAFLGILDLVFAKLFALILG